MAYIEFDNVRFSYNGKTPALDGLNLGIEKGEFVCIMGANGSGKSTLGKHLNALLVPDEGHVSVAGMDTSAVESAFAVRSRVSMVFQNPDDQIVASIVEDEVAFGPENLGITPAEIRERVTLALAAAGLGGFEHRDVATLSGGQKQRLAIAGALAMRPEVLVLDEAGAMLDPDGRSAVMGICHDLNGRGITIVMITQNVEEALEADRIVVLDDGRVALEGTPREVLLQVGALRELALDVPLPVQLSCALRERGLDVPLCMDVDELRRSLGREVAGQLGNPGSDAPGQAPASAGGKPAEGEPPESVEPSVEGVPLLPGKSSAPAESLQGASDSSTGAAAPFVLSLRDVSFSYSEPEKGRKRTEAQAAMPLDSRVLRNLSFDLREGECLGITGPTGSGKSTLLQLCKGLLAPREGVVLVRGRSLSQGAADGANRQVGIVFQYPEQQLFAQTVFDDVAFGPRNLGYSREETEARVREALMSIHLDPDELEDCSPFALSAGQQRRVALAGVLAIQPDVLLLDEPTAGLDPAARERFRGLIAELSAQRHLSCIVVSHDMDDLAQLCDRIAVLVEGEIVALGTPTCVFADKVAVLRGRLKIPGTLSIASALNLPVDHIPTIDELAERISRTL